jgi:restriction endonuclease Mrr
LEELVGPNGHPRRIKALIETELISAFGFSPLAAAELADRRALAVARLISAREQTSYKDGTVYALAIVGEGYESIAGSCYPLPADTPDIAKIKHHRARATEVLTAIRDLEFTQFEKFGAKVLKELGATNTRVTKQSNDQGIDFFGELSLGSLGSIPAPFLRLAHDVRFTFAGQAKHYPTRSLNPDVVRELVGAISLARTKTFSKDNIDVLDGVYLKPFSPLLALLFTTGGITSGAAHLATEAGIIARNGEQLAVFLADKGIGMVQSNGVQSFSHDAFVDWLNSD